MALLGMGANVQCNGYVPGYYSTRDLIVGTKGSIWTSSNGNIELNNDCYDNGSLPVSTPVHLLEYNKELLKQTILKHEAIFTDQIHELHRLYRKQRELMDEVKRNELVKHNLRLETSWSSSFMSHVSSKNEERICCSPNLPWSTGQSSAIIAESIRLPSGQESSRKIYSAPASTPTPTSTEGYSKDSKLSESKYRKVGKKLLDLHLPADEYIDSEDGESLEDERVSKLPRVSAYTLKVISQAVSNSDNKPHGANSNGFTDLNEPYNIEEETTVKSDDLMGCDSSRKNPFYDLSTRTKLRCHNLPSDVIWNPSKRQDSEVCSDDLPLEQKKHEQLSSMNTADQMNQEAWSGRKFSSGESSAGTQGPTCAGLLGSSSYPYQLVSEADMTSSRISPPVLWKTPLSDLGEGQTAVQALPCFSTSAPLDQSSKPLMGMPGLTGDEFYRFRSIKSGPSLDCQNFLLSSFCSASKTSVSLSISTDDRNSFGNQSSSTSRDLRKYIKCSEDGGFSKNINLNIMPANFSDTIAFQSIKEDLVPKGKPYEESKISTRMETVLLKPHELVTHGFELKMVEASDLSRQKIHAVNINGEPDTSSKLHSPHASPSRICQHQTKNQKIEEIEKGCVSDLNLPCNHVPELGDRVTAGENLMKNEQEGEHKCLAGIIDLNSCMNEDENMPIDIDLQAPVSPENKESSPPRGESDENQLEMLYRLAGQEYSELQEEEARIAAEALVSISAFVCNIGLQPTTCPPSESFVSGTLHWFAGIVSSITGHPDNDVKVDFSGNPDELEEFLPAGIDYFEAMTLKLTERKDLDCCGKRSDQKEEEGGSTSPSQPRKGWTNRGRRRKDFQSEILPSLASLSRYEVTEDLQTIGGLMEATVAHSETGSLRGACRNALTRGRRRSCTSASNNSDLLLKQLTSITELGIEKRSLISWGKINKKRRGQRYRARNSQFILSQV